MRVQSPSRGAQSRFAHARRLPPNFIKRFWDGKSRTEELHLSCGWPQKGSIAPSRRQASKILLRCTSTCVLFMGPAPVSCCRMGRMSGCDSRPCRSSMRSPSGLLSVRDGERACATRCGLGAWRRAARPYPGPFRPCGDALLELHHGEVGFASYCPAFVPHRLRGVSCKGTVSHNPCREPVTGCAGLGRRGHREHS